MTSPAKHPSARWTSQAHRNCRRVDRRRFRRLFLETLESRQVLSTFPAPIDNWNQAEFEEAQALIRFRGDATDQQITQFMSARQLGVITKWDDLDMYHVRFPTVRGRDQTIATVKALHEQSLVEYAEPNFTMHINRLPNDPLFLDQWGLNNIGQNSPFAPFLGGAFDADIDAVEGWDTQIGDPQTVIAIVDTGIDYLHPDLVANIWRNPGEIADGFDNDGNGFVDDVLGWDTFDNDNDPMDFNGHGTHVAGISGADTDNNLGVAGVNWNTKVMAIKASDDAGAGLSSAAIVGAQAYITRMKVQFGINIVVSNNSYGGPTFSFAQFDAIRLATNAGIGFVAAAGNNGFNTDAPANIQYPMGFNLPGIISVAATTRDNTRATFSNFGFFTVDLGAPGEEILSTYSTSAPLPGGQPPAPNVPPPGYAWIDGTSMASPMVAGAYAVIKTFDPSLTVAQVKNLLITTVDLLPDLTNRSVSGGRLNLQRALDEIPRNEFHGTIFLDLDGDGRFDANETTQSGWTVYVDLNNNEVLDGNEPFTLSQADGTYNLRAKLLRGDYFIREVIQPGWIQTFPGPAADHTHHVTVTTTTQVFEDLDFGNKPIPGSISGVKYNDVNANGQRDAGEPGIAGFVIYVDINNDGAIGVGEPAAITDAQGRYQINSVRPGVHVVREVQKPGYVQTEPDPSGPLAGGVSVVVNGNNVTSGVLFGNRAALDWGDAPTSYGTLSANNGARHGLLAGLFLGDPTDTTSVHIDDELNGFPTADADGDDINQDDDEDGVIFLTDVIPGQNATIQVSASSGPFGSGFLHAWIDFNNDGDFFDAGEQIIKNRSLISGTHLITIAVPASATVSDTYARFRWGFERDLGPTGFAKGGEVEDYSTAARAVAPTAIDDFVTVGRDSNFIDNPIDVMANDFPGVSGDPFTILDFTPPVNGGLVILDDQGTTDPSDDILRYRPPSNTLGTDSFTYRIWDGTNVSNAGTVHIEIVPLNPEAIDDTFDVPPNTTTDLDVLANDIEGVNGPLSILSVGVPAEGSATIVGGKVRYTPPAGFTGSDSFTYTVFDGANVSSAAVLVQVGGPTTDHLVQIEYRVFKDVNGIPTELPNNATINVGETVELWAFTLDRRGPFMTPDFPGVTDVSGVLSAWADALYDSELLTPVPEANIFGVDIDFGPRYNVARTATASLPGLVDEVGALHVYNFLDPLGMGPNLLFRMKFTAENVGSFKFKPNPAEDSDEITGNRENLSDPPVVTFLNEQIFFKSSPTINIISAGDAEATNSLNPLDVNQDTIVSGLDASLVINHLNRNGAGSFSPTLAAALGQGLSQFYIDVNVDGLVSASDAKQVIDYLNFKSAIATSSSSSIQAEGESDADVARLVAGSTSSSTVSSSGSTSVASSDDAPSDYAVSVDRVLTDYGVVTKPQSPAVNPVEEHDDEQEEEGDEEAFFAALGST